MTLTEIFAKVLNMSLTASLVIVLVMAARFVLRKSPKVFSYALWAVVLFRLLCPVSLPSPVSLLGLLDAPVAQTEGVTTTVEYIPYKVVEAAAENPQPEQLPQNAVMQAPTQSQQTTVQPHREPLSAAEIITYIWLAGIAVMVTIGVGSYLRFRKHLTVAMQVKDNIYLVDHIDSAFVAGLIRPRIYLPSDIPLKQMGYIIAHEQYHIRRLDHVTKHLSFAALCIHWFNPFVWVAFILSGKDLEMSCDEAVIKKLGEGIRADYSASLLSLATGRRIIAGTPLAFGEGDTKGRIKNMAKWKQPKKWVSIVSFILCFTILTACAANPEQEVVISKNDGSFDANVVQSATNASTELSEQGSTSVEKDNTRNVQYTGSFLSTDESVEFTLDIDTDITTAAMPVVEVEPHFLTGEDVQRVAKVLFGDAEIYEQGTLIDEVFTKSHIQKTLNMLSPYVSVEKMEELYTPRENQTDYLSEKAENLKRILERITERYETAPEENPYGLCQWTFKNDAYYFYTEEEIASGSVTFSDMNEEIAARVEVNGIPYSFSASRRNQNDFKINNIYVRIDNGIGSTLADDIYEAQLCVTEKPAEEQVAAVKAKAEKMLADMELGDWYVDECYVEVRGESWERAQTEYVVCINAVPVTNGVPAIRRVQFSNLKSKETYASNYYLTDANFEFSANGDLVSFQMYSTIDVTEIVNDNVATLQIDEMMETAKNHLSLSDRSNYGFPEELLTDWDEYYGETTICKVHISELEYGMTRVKVPNTDDSYYYVPSMILSGTRSYYGKDTDTFYETVKGSVNSDGIYPLVAINAVDGSIIELYQ